MKDFSVRIKILLLAVIMLVITCVVAAVGIYSNHQSKQSADDMYNYNLMTTQYLNDATVQIRTIDSDIDFLLLNDLVPENRKMLLDDMGSKTKAIQQDIEKSRKSTAASAHRRRSASWRRIPRRFCPASRHRKA